MNQPILTLRSAIILCTASLLIFAGCNQNPPPGGSGSPAVEASEATSQVPKPAAPESSSPGPSVGTDSSPAVDSTSQPADPTSPSQPPSTAERPAGTEAAASENPGDAGNAACLTGTWRMKNETFQAALGDLMAGAPAGDVTVVGESFIRFDGVDTYTSWQEDYGFEFGGPNGQVTHKQNAGDAGNYYADDQMVWVYDVLMAYLEATMDVAGVGSVDVSGDGGGTATVHLFNYTTDALPAHLEYADGAAAYECSDTELVLHADGGLWAGFTRVTSS